MNPVCLSFVVIILRRENRTEGEGEERQGQYCPVAFTRVLFVFLFCGILCGGEDTIYGVARHRIHDLFLLYSPFIKYNNHTREYKQKNHFKNSEKH